MATAQQLAALDEAHRTQQAVNAGALVLALNEVWQAVQPTSLAATGTAWLRDAIALIASRRRLSSLYALDYARKVRTLQVGVDEMPAILAPDFPRLIKEWEGVLGGRANGKLFVPLADLPEPPPGLPGPNVEQIRESLTHVGLRLTAVGLHEIPAKRTNPIADPFPAPGADPFGEDRQRILRESSAIDDLIKKTMAAGQQRAGAAGMRHTQNGGRDAVDEAVRADRKARGWIRVTRPACCYFCAMLASRGPVYSKESFDESDKKRTSDPRADFIGKHRVHDNCGCVLRPVYTRDGTEWTTVARESSDIWEDIRTSTGRTPRVEEFRTRWDARNATMQ